MGSFFIHSALAWAALALVSIPIIIHLINRRRFRRIDWAAMEFLLDALKKNRRRVRIEQLILLLLRIAMMALIALLLARPVLSDKGFEWLAGAFRSEDKIFIIDDSFSTSRREADRSVFQREADALAGQIRRLAEHGGGDRFTLLRGSRPETPIARGIFVDRERSAVLAQTVSRLAATDARLPLAAALDAVVEGSAREGQGSARPRALSLLTDLSATDWTDGRGGPDDAVHTALKRLVASEETPTRIAVLDVGADDGANVAITSVSVDGGKPVAEVPSDLRIDVHNFGAVPARGLGLKLRFAPAPVASGDERAASAIGPPIDEISPGGTATVTMPCTFRSTGYYGVVVELTGARDALPGDNSFPLAVEVVAGTEVLLVNGEPSSEPFEGETDFLAEALSPAGEVASGVRPQVVIEENIPRQDLSRYAAIFIANLHSLPQDFLPLVGRYVREGGTLVIFPGDQTDAPLWNRQLGGEAAGAVAGKDAPPERGLLPARIGEMRTEEDPLGFAPAFDHAYFRLLREAKDLAGMVRFQKRFVLEPSPRAQVIARFTDAGESPAIVEHTVDKGRVILFASAADLEWNDWPRNPAYLMTLQELTSVAARARSERTEHLAGHPVDVPIDVSQYALQARLRTPAYPDEPETVLAASEKHEAGGLGVPGGAAFRFEIRDTSRAGLYALGLKTKSGEEEWREIAVRRDAAESNLARVSAGRLRELYPDVELNVMRDSSAFADVGRGGFETSDVLLWAFLAFLFVEALLARLFAHHPPAGASSASSGKPSPGGGAP